MTTIRVTFADGHTRIARTSDTPDQLRDYYFSRRFGIDGGKPTVAVRIDYLDPISGTPCINGRIA